MRPSRPTTGNKPFFRKCYAYTRARDVRELGLYPYGVTLDRESDGTRLTLNGRKILMFGSNDYLGLTQDTRVKEAAVRALNTFGSGCSGSRMLNGTLQIHKLLEAELAEFMRRDDVCLFSTGYQANHGCLTALSLRGDYVVMDKDNHACLVDGCRASVGRMVRFRHGDIADLERTLEALPPDGGKLIVMDGVFSMQGDIVDLPAVADLANRFEAGVFLDEAHSVGVLGEHGRGVGEFFGIEDSIDIISGTFSKSMASVGGFVASTSEVIEYLRHHCRSYIFSASLPPACVGAVRQSLRIIQEEPERRERVMDLGRRIRRGVEALGFDVPPGEAPIIPVVLGDDMIVMRAFHALLDEGVYINPVLPPAASQGLLRISCMATHEEEDCDRLFEAMERVGRDLSLLDLHHEATQKEK